MRLVIVMFVATACWRSPQQPLAPRVFEGIALIRSPCIKSSLAVRVAIDGTPGWFVIDSGAFVSVVYERFAKRAKLALEDNADRLGGGPGVRVFKVLPKAFAIPGLDGVQTPNLMMLEHSASPLSRDDCDIAGVIAPAHLATDEVAVIIDYGARVLARVPTTEVDAYLSRISGPKFTGTLSSIEYTPGIDVKFGDKSLRMMLDTGACCTWVTTTSQVGKSYLPSSRPGGSIARLMGNAPSRIATADLKFGEVGRKIDIKILDPHPGDAIEDGGIGADSLDGCIVAITPDKIRGVCR